MILFTVALISAATVRAQDSDSDGVNLPDLSVGNGLFSSEVLTYFAFGDHNLIDADQDFMKYKGKAVTEFQMNIVELRLNPYPTGWFTLGLDFDWDYYRLDNTHFWQPDGSGKVTIAPMEGSGMKKIKKSRLSVRTLAVPVSFNQSFGQFSLRIGAAAEYNFPGITRFKGTSAEGGTVKEWKSGSRFSKDIKTNAFTYNVFGALSYDDVGVYVKYCPVSVFQEGYGPQFKAVTIGVIVGLGM